MELPSHPSEARLPSVEGGQKPLAPVPVDLQLGGAPHEIQTLHLRWDPDLEVMMGELNFELWTTGISSLGHSQTPHGSHGSPRCCLRSQDVVHGLQVILSEALLAARDIAVAQVRHAQFITIRGSYPEHPEVISRTGFSNITWQPPNEIHMGKSAPMAPPASHVR